MPYYYPCPWEGLGQRYEKIKKPPTCNGTPGAKVEAYSLLNWPLPRFKSVVQR